MNPYGNESVGLSNDKVMKWGNKSENEGESVWNFEDILETQHTPNWSYYMSSRNLLHWSWFDLLNCFASIWTLADVDSYFYFA